MNSEKKGSESPTHRQSNKKTEEFWIQISSKWNAVQVKLKTDEHSTEKGVF